MAHEISFVDNTGTEGVAHWQFLLKIKALAEANGWTTLRYLDPVPYTDNTVVRELILQGEGLGGTDEIFIGFRAYQSQSADVYNISMAAFTGYVAGNAFTAQPGFIESGIPAHNNRIDYWLVVNAQRIVFGLKIGTPVYVHGYVGKFLPYATPGQYPYPVVCAGMLNGTPLTRFSDTVYSMPYRGTRANMRMRFVDGVWRQPDCYPWNNARLAGGTQLRDTGNNYKPLAVVLNDNYPNIYGELDGVFSISGFNNATENTMTIDGVDYVILQDVSRNGFIDYIALELS